MSVPKVTVTLENGAIGGRVASLDGVSCLTLTGVTATGLALATPKVIFSLKEAEALGITETGSNAYAWRQISEFYTAYNFITGLEIAELYIMLLADTVTLEQMADKDFATGAKKALDYAKGRVRLLGIARNPDGSYVPTLTSGIDADSIAAITKAQLLGNTMATAQNPIRTLIDARAFEAANIGDLADLSLRTDNRAGLVMWSTTNDGNTSVGATLGLAAGVEVQRNIGRIKNGALPWDAIYIGDTLAEDMVNSVDAIDSKRYIIATTMPNKTGYFINDDHMATSETDDYSNLSDGRVIDKAHRIAYATYVEELKDDVETVEGGFLSEGVLKTLESRIDDEINLNMANNISDGARGSRHGFIDDTQNVTTTEELEVIVRIRKKGQIKDYNVKLGFSL